MRFTVPGIHLTRRLLRPPNTCTLEPRVPRQFSRKPPRLLLVSHQSSPRPQLPFLYPSAQYLSNGQTRILRLFSISVNHKKYIKEVSKLTVRYTVYIFLITSCFSIASLGILSERQERAFPSPHEWSLITRFRFRRGKWWEVPEHNEEEGFPNWARLYDEYQHALKRLENPNKDGNGILEQEMVGGVAQGFDVTAKSGEWRQGYYEVLMGMAGAAERLEGWVTDKTRRNIWSPEFIASSSNPRPKATPPGMPVPPEEHLQVPAADTPETFYLRILTSKGFTTHQRLKAALGYADWLSFKKLPDSAEEVYQWALDIALAGVPTLDHSTVIDTKTNVLSFSAPKDKITPNLIFAATSLATFYASQGNVTAALPILISVLRARLAADPAPPAYVEPPPDSSLTGTLLSLLAEPPYPPLPPTGDEPLLRRIEDRCEEAALKIYIGEILFATAGSSSIQRTQGLSWVRDAVSTSKIAQSLDPITMFPERKKKCEQCEEVGLEAWGKMMTFLAAEARDKRDKANAGGVMSWIGSLWGARKGLDEKVEDLEGEEEGVVMRLNKLRGRMLREEYEDMDRKYAKTFVF
ncbi:hypothetical protein K504DRAFT_467538 [Pleomassaria siparia CBS 279.74]|uniref:MFS maltose permease n=1 Tax=Pleomassaria siparia CBS 279.74 TaxID=1314801 RepID=A0A6G1K9K4_9PLEO|nr:hypothetical protein K504DRAFT_467538 [Pleomassaria siparia CBS 279.74]